MNNKQWLAEVKENVQEEHKRAIQSLLDIAGFELEDEEGYVDLNEIKAKMKDKGYKITAFQGEELEHFFVLSLNSEYVAGCIVSVNFELGQIKRTMIPHNNEIDAKWAKAIKGGF